MAAMANAYALLDAGDGRRLERFGDRVIDRPAPAAAGPRGDAAAWRNVDARFERGRGEAGRWEARADVDPWLVEVDGIRLELRLASGGQVGLFPEHLGQADWLRRRVHEAADASVLHLFGYTGALTLVAARGGAAVAHVDASRAAVAWARRNAELSAAADCPIRWLVEDAERFVRREGTRGRRYSGVVLDPPTYGHDPSGRAWHLEDRLDPLLRSVVALLDGPSRFVLLTAHTPQFGPDVLRERLASALGTSDGIEADELALAAENRVRLRLGAFARWSTTAAERETEEAA